MRKLFYSLILALLALPGMSQTTWRVFDINNSGIAHNNSHDIKVDATGIKWIATSGGVSCFDDAAWISFNTQVCNLPSNFIYDVAISKANVKWVGMLNDGVAKYLGNNMWQMYDLSNSGIPSNTIYDVATDAQDNLWVATPLGIGKFDGSNWTTYNTSTSGFFPSPIINTMTFAPNGDLWFGTSPQGNFSGGLGNFNGTMWNKLTTVNGLPDNRVTSLTYDPNGHLWVGTQNGLAEYDGSSFTVYTTSNSGLPDNYINDIAVDSLGTIWVATKGGGLGNFNGTTWDVKNTTNSAIPSNEIRSVGIDQHDNKWCTTNSGMCVYNKNGIVISVDPGQAGWNEQAYMEPVYPNPASANSMQIIPFHLPAARAVSLGLYDLQGRLVSQVAEGKYYPAGNHEIQTSLANVPAGLYVYRLQAGSFTASRRVMVK